VLYKNKSRNYLILLPSKIEYGIFMVCLFWKRIVKRLNLPPFSVILFGHLLWGKPVAMLRASLWRGPCGEVVVSDWEPVRTWGLQSTFLQGTEGYQQLIGLDMDCSPVRPSDETAAPADSLPATSQMTLSTNHLSKDSWIPEPKKMRDKKIVILTC